jgi:putative PIN family toxin of toxin-antitoxin system
MRIILDTNLWISFLISRSFNKLDALLFSGNCTILFSRELLEEFLTVANRPKLRKYFTPSELKVLVEMLNEIAEFVNVKSNVNLCRDPKDNFLLALAKDGKADYLLTGDNDLLVLEKMGKTNIIKITEFFEQVDL